MKTMRAEMDDLRMKNAELDIKNADLEAKLYAATLEPARPSVDYMEAKFNKIERMIECLSNEAKFDKIESMINGLSADSCSHSYASKKSLVY